MDTVRKKIFAMEKGEERAGGMPLAYKAAPEGFAKVREGSANFLNNNVKLSVSGIWEVYLDLDPVMQF